MKRAVFILNYGHEIFKRLLVSAPHFWSGHIGYTNSGAAKHTNKQYLGWSACFLGDVYAAREVMLSRMS